jgi:prepilin-type N-terminal cleavage/methylation domain-containing protein/prepilin-type processing-associated H-X9-DG protein
MHFPKDLFNMIINRKRNSRNGFTLVELLVVIGIIAILAAVSAPAYLTALSHARTAKCSGNLRTIGAAMITYAGDNNGNLPVSGGTIQYGHVDTVTGKPSWTEQLDTYLGSTGSTSPNPNYANPIFQCPDWANTADKTTGKAVPTGLNPCISYSYFNGSHAGGAGQGNYGPVNLFKIKATSGHIIAGDISFGSYSPLTPPYDADPDDYGNSAANDPAFAGANYDGTTTTTTLTILKHNGTANLVFADGHVSNAKVYDRTSMTTHYAGIVLSEKYSDYP